MEEAVRTLIPLRKRPAVGAGERAALADGLSRTRVEINQANYTLRAASRSIPDILAALTRPLATIES